MSKVYLRQPGFTYSAWIPFIKNKKRIKKFKETGDSRHIYQNKLDKACFQHNMEYGGFKDFNKKTFADKLLRDKAFNMAKHPKYGGYQTDLALIVYRFCDEKISGRGIKNENISNKELAKKLHKQLIRKLKKRNVHSPFISNTWGVDLANMQLISKFNKGLKFLICAVYIYRKYAWVIPLKDKKVL